MAVVVLEFTPRLSEVTAEAFAAEMLFDSLAARAVVGGRTASGTRPPATRPSWPSWAAPAGSRSSPSPCAPTATSRCPRPASGPSWPRAMWPLAAALRAAPTASRGWWSWATAAAAPPGHPHGQPRHPPAGIALPADGVYAGHLTDEVDGARRRRSASAPTPSSAPAGSRPTSSTSTATSTATGCRSPSGTASAARPPSPAPTSSSPRCKRTSTRPGACCRLRRSSIAPEVVWSRGRRASPWRRLRLGTTLVHALRYSRSSDRSWGLVSASRSMFKVGRSTDWPSPREGRCGQEEGRCGRANRSLTATSSATGSRSTTSCSAPASRRCCCCRPGRSCTRTGRCRSYLARHCRVVTFDGRGNGRSDRPTEPEAYAEPEFAADAIAVMDATGTDRADHRGLLDGRPSRPAAGRRPSRAGRGGRVHRRELPGRRRARGRADGVLLGGRAGHRRRLGQAQLPLLAPRLPGLPRVLHVEDVHRAALHQADRGRRRLGSGHHARDALAHLPGAVHGA